MELLTAIYSDGTISHLDFQTGAVLRTFEGNGTNPVVNISNNNTNTAINQFAVHPSNGTFCSSLYPSKPIFLAWHPTKGKQPYFRASFAEKMSCARFSNCGLYLITGSVSGKIYVWLISNGNLVTCIERAHYKHVVNIMFSSDGTLMITSGGDGTVHVWKTWENGNHMGGICSKQQSNGGGGNSSFTNFYLTPFRSFSSHTLSVTAIAIVEGISGFNSKIISSSLDHTVKIHDIQSGQTLSTYIKTSAVTSLCVDETRNIAYCGCKNGELFKIDLDGGNQNSSGITAAGSGITAAGSGGVGSESRNNTNDSFIGHSSTILSLQLSLDRSRLVSSDSENIKIYDTLSRECVKTLEPGKNGAFTSAGIIRQNHHGQEPVFFRPFQRVIADTENEFARTTKSVEKSSNSSGRNVTRKDRLAMIRSVNFEKSCDRSNKTLLSSNADSDHMTLPLDADTILITGTPLTTSDDVLTREAGQAGMSRCTRNNMNGVGVQQAPVTENSTTIDMDTSELPDSEDKSSENESNQDSDEDEEMEDETGTKRQRISEVVVRPLSKEEELQQQLEETQKESERWKKVAQDLFLRMKQ